MQSLAAQLGIGRATLYRRVRSRDQLLAEVVWFLCRVAMARSLMGTDRRGGLERVVLIIDRFMHDIHGQPALRRLLEAEPEIALRILTSKHGPVQGGIVKVLEHLLERELGGEGSKTPLELATLAYVVVRIGESFLYADVIAGHEPDVDEAMQVIAVLLRSAAPLRAV
jgi:AcrR family transcriptional regulator